MREVPPLPIRRLIFTTPPLPVAPSASSSASGPPRNRAYPSLAEPLSDAAPCGSWRNSLKTRQTMEECALATPPNVPFDQVAMRQNRGDRRIFRCISLIIDEMPLAACSPVYAKIDEITGL